MKHFNKKKTTSSFQKYKRNFSYSTKAYGYIFVRQYIDVLIPDESMSIFALLNE